MKITFNIVKAILKIRRSESLVVMAFQHDGRLCQKMKNKISAPFYVTQT